ncbi:MAG: hypothetical protein MHMPM18_004288 [Marteilia pararefringens]
MRFTKILLLALSVNFVMAELRVVEKDQSYFIKIEKGSTFDVVKDLLVKTTSSTGVKEKLFYISSVDFEKAVFGIFEIKFSEFEKVSSNANDGNAGSNLGQGQQAGKQKLPNDWKQALDEVRLMYCTSAANAFSQKYIDYFVQNFGIEDAIIDFSVLKHESSVQCQGNGNDCKLSRKCEQLAKENELELLAVNNERVVLRRSPAKQENLEKEPTHYNLIIALSVGLGFFCVCSIGLLAVVICRRRRDE